MIQVLDTYDTKNNPQKAVSFCSVIVFPPNQYLFFYILSMLSVMVQLNTCFIFTPKYQTQTALLIPIKRAIHLQPNPIAPTQTTLGAVCQVQVSEKQTEVREGQQRVK